MLSEKEEKNLKNLLLSSGLPLEHLVAQKLSEKEFHISGEYSYIRPDEQYINKEFSTDLHAIYRITDNHIGHWADLHLLVECKYRHPNTNWVFYAHPSPNCVTMDIVTVIQDLCTERIMYEYLFPIYQEILQCIRGTELKGNKPNSSEISHGLSQLRYAVPNLIMQLMNEQVNTVKDNKTDDLRIKITCPMLITTAKLHVIKPGLDLNDFHQSQDLMDVVEEVDSLIVTQSPSSSQLQKYSLEVFDSYSFLYAPGSLIRHYMESLSNVLLCAGIPPDMLPNYERLRYSVMSASELIIIVNYEAMDKRVDSLLNGINESSKTLKKYATLDFKTRRNPLNEPYYAFFAGDDKYRQ